MKTQAKNRLVMTKAEISVRRPSSNPGCYSWVWVNPMLDGRFRVAAIEVPKHLVDEDVCFYDGDFETPYIKIVSEISEIDDAVREVGADPEELDAPWYNDFPL
ncbi:hypothetical protein I6A84_15360 [Frankia sp. CNm7]|uniref:Uncharacterized protein n=1 Tax=Frankia nepalensis TaxID=1836974 RepID=A0A937RH38_9ACTN|nr:hypothetical protein [Frankia nepalensis]MBL7498708.1 hypothetical protein [Frankia nepalensis]MBL7508427.1 hypothetical protein [Frankia nepalensis]MBL7519442.1 hypothetical protein [Frankia nepalensis]MBL7626258.1 hypothetical protein [Frankia nepalensis]